MARQPPRDIVSSRKTERGDTITIERTPRWAVWITAFDGEDEVGLGLSIKDAMWLMAALQCGVDGPMKGAEPKGPPLLTVVRNLQKPQPRRGPLGVVGKPRLVRGAEEEP